MKSMIRFVLFFVVTISLPSLGLAQSDLLDNATSFEFGTVVNDVVYDSSRGVLYASIPSSAGFPFGNSIATIDPVSGAVLDSIFVGSEPNTLAISEDNSFVFVGIDGARSVRTWQPGSNTLGNLIALNARFGDQAVAHDIAAVPGQPEQAIVSADGVGSTANGSLVHFDGAEITALGSGFEGVNYLGFTNPTTVAGFDDSNTGFRASRWEFLGPDSFSSLGSQTGVVGSFDVEAEVASNGLFYFSDGTVIDPSNFVSLGRFNTGLASGSQLVEPVPSLELNYFVGTTSAFGGGGDVVLTAFDLNTFLQIDSVVLSAVPSSSAQDRGELIAAGENRLAFVWKPQQFDGPGGSGVLTIVSGIPVSSTIVGDVSGDGVVDFLDISPFISVLSTGDFLAEADIDGNGVVNFLDIAPFIALLGG